MSNGTPCCSVPCAAIKGYICSAIKYVSEYDTWASNGTSRFSAAIKVYSEHLILHRKSTYAF